MKNKHLHSFGQCIAVAAALITLLTFVTAMFTPPLSGPFCPGGCFEYPYLDIAGRFPRDYYWMYPAMALELLFPVLMICIHQATDSENRHFSLAALVFASMSSLILFADYFIQVAVVQPSLMAGESDGISLLSQYNPHGIFIVLEEAGFFLMVFSLFCLYPVFPGRTRTENRIRRTVLYGFILCITSFILIAIQYGINREYRFEVAIITIAWTEFIVLSLLLVKFFASRTPETEQSFLK